MFSAEDILNIAIKIEENGEEFYLKLSERAQKNPSLQDIAEIAERLAREEREHRKQFLKLKQNVLINKESDILKKISNIYIQDAIGDNLFSLTNDNIDRLESVDDVMNIAIKLEEESIKFYEILKLLTDEEGKKIIDKIIEEERFHKTTLSSWSSSY